MRAWPALVVFLLVAAGCASGPSGSPSGAPSARLAADGLPATDCLSLVGGAGGIDLQRASLADIEAALAAGTVTSVDLVKAYSARIRAFDWANATTGPKLNAVQEINPHALDIAAALDAERASGHVRGPLHGIPILLKDNVGTKDEPTTAGSIALEKNVPKADARLTEKLHEAGLVILGKLHMSEFAQWISLNNPNGYSSLGGQVVNAYTGGDPSGSSAGSGVAGSMAFAAITIGTETQGSILGPTDLNSLAGVKPTVGLVSRAGIIPLAASFDTPGPMGRSVRDVAALLGVVAGADPKDPATTAAKFPPNNDYLAGLTPDALKGARLGYDSSDNNALFVKARANLTALGAVLVPISGPAPQAGNPNNQLGPENLDSSGASELGLIFNEFKAGINAYLANEAGPGLPVSDLTGIIQYNQMHQDRVKYGQDLLIGSEATPGVDGSQGLLALPLITAQRARIDQVFSGNQLDAIVGPGLAYYQGGAEAGYPTVMVPMGYTGHTPHGLSFFGQAWTEPKLLGYAYAYENATRVRQPPNFVNTDLLKDVCRSSATP